MPETTSNVDFIRRLLQIFHAQLDAITRGDLIAARTASEQLRYSLPGLVQVVKLSRKGSESSAEEQDHIERMIREIKNLHANANESIQTKRNSLASLLIEFRRGRQLINGYKSGTRSGGKLFEMIG